MVVAADLLYQTRSSAARAAFPAHTDGIDGEDGGNESLASTQDFPRDDWSKSRRNMGTKVYPDVELEVVAY